MLIYFAVLNEISPLIAFKKKLSTMEFFVISLFDLTLEARLHVTWFCVQNNIQNFVFEAVPLE